MAKLVRGTHQWHEVPELHFDPDHLDWAQNGYLTRWLDGVRVELREYNYASQKAFNTTADGDIKAMMHKYMAEWAEKELPQRIEARIIEILSGKHAFDFTTLNQRLFATAKRAMIEETTMNVMTGAGKMMHKIRQLEKRMEKIEKSMAAIETQIMLHKTYKVTPPPVLTLDEPF